MTRSILGVDIAKDSFQVCLLQAGKKYNRTFRNETKGFASSLSERESGSPLR